MFNMWRNVWFMDEGLDMFPPKRWKHWLTIHIWLDEDKEPTIEWLIEMLDCGLQPLIDKKLVKVKDEGKKQTITIWEYQITRPKPEEIEVDVVEVLPIEEE